MRWIWATACFAIAKVPEQRIRLHATSDSRGERDCERHSPLESVSSDLETESLADDDRHALCRALAQRIDDRERCRVVPRIAVCVRSGRKRVRSTVTERPGVSVGSKSAGQVRIEIDGKRGNSLARAGPYCKAEGRHHRDLRGLLPRQSPFIHCFEPYRIRSRSGALMVGRLVRGPRRVPGSIAVPIPADLQQGGGILAIPGRRCVDLEYCYGQSR